MAIASSATLIGTSTGVYACEHSGDWPALVAAASQQAGEAIELSALVAGEVQGLLQYLRGFDAEPFGFVSVHGPVKGWDGNGAGVAAWAAELPAYVEVVVLHPETIVDGTGLAALGPRLALENMDSRKPGGRTVEELRPSFAALPEARFCFDIAHAHSVDPSMALAHELLDAFGDRVSHVHLSSLDGAGRHVALTPEDARAFVPVLDRLQGVPWILEARMGAPSQS